MFGKIMRLPDHLLENYYTLLTDLPPEQFKPAIATNPRDAKAALAKWIITWLHDAQSAAAAEAEFVKTTHGGVPEEMPEFSIGAEPQKLAPLLVKAGLAASNGEAMRKMKEGAVKIDGQKVTDPSKDYSFDKAVVLQLGNRKFARLLPGK
jgi:tyrosyl-tRNA synthetase